MSPISSENNKTVEDLNQLKSSGEDLTGKYLTLKLGEEAYGLEILKVREIIGMLDITHVPRAPHYVKGVINLRGKVIPVIDLRIKLGLQEKEYNERTCIVVVEAIEDGEKGLVGVVVDSVSEVMTIRGEQIETDLSMDSEVDSRFILGMAKTDSGLKLLLDTDEALKGSAGLIA